MKRNNQIQSKEKQQPVEEKYRKSNVTEEECRRLAGELELLMQRDRLYVNPNLKIADLDVYKRQVIYLSKKDNSQYRINVEVRAYDEGVGFRYFFPEHPDAIFHKVVDDLTEYTFEPGAKAWVAEWAQAPYNLLPIDDIKEPAERALTVELPNGLWVSLTDADVDAWCQIRFIAAKNKANTLASDMYSIVDVVTYAATPWKVILVADCAGDLIEHNDIVLNFNPCLLYTSRDAP